MDPVHEAMNHVTARRRVRVSRRGGTWEGEAVALIDKPAIVVELADHTRVPIVIEHAEIEVIDG